MRGGDKLLERVENQPLVSLICARAAATGLPVWVTLPRSDHPRAEWIGGATPVIVADANDGMGASIRAGIAALSDDIDAVMILPADMPEITQSDLCTLAQAVRFDDCAPIVRGASVDGKPGHPVVFPRSCFAALSRLSGDFGAREVVARHAHGVHLVALPDRHALTDLDTPEDWAEWRARGRR